MLQTYSFIILLIFLNFRPIVYTELNLQLLILNILPEKPYILFFSLRSKYDTFRNFPSKLKATVIINATCSRSICFYSK